MHRLRHNGSPERLAPTLVASSARSIVSKSLWILVLALCAAPPASAEIFKCAGKNGTVLYQNFPCQFESLGWLPSNPPSAKATLPPTDASQPKAKAAPVNVASTVKSATASEPGIGMTAEEVRALLGEPEEMVEDEPASGGRVSIWRYADGRSVQFDHKHHVLEVQR